MTGMPYIRFILLKSLDIFKVLYVMKHFYTQMKHTETYVVLFICNFAAKLNFN